MQSINPATGEAIRAYEEHDVAAVERALERAVDAQAQWALTSFAHRAGCLEQAAARLEEGREALAQTMAQEMGKPIGQGRAEVDKCAWVCRFYAEWAEAFLADEEIASDAGHSWVSCQPLGLVLAIMPWNFPLWQVFRFAAPTLMAGNGALLKHASNVPGAALAIERIWHQAGLPADLFRTLLIPAARVEPIIRDVRVAAVTLTGSTAAGRAVASVAGEALKKTVLELGGSDPYLILADADLDLAVPACVTARLINSGQSCIAAKRFIVVEAIREDFEERFVAEMGDRIMGDPLAEDTDVGPQATVALRDELHQQVQDSLAAGARLLLGGEVPEQAGAWYPPTVLTDVPAGCPAATEELFGPVAAILPVASEEAAIRLANDSRFGLGAAVFTRDVGRGERIAAEDLQAGACFVNAFVRSDPRLPFGGIKESGYGRELGPAGIREFVNLKTVYRA